MNLNDSMHQPTRPIHSSMSNALTTQQTPQRHEGSVHNNNKLQNSNHHFPAQNTDTLNHIDFSAHHTYMLPKKIKGNNSQRNKIKNFSFSDSINKSPSLNGCMYHQSSKSDPQSIIDSQIPIPQSIVYSQQPVPHSVVNSQNQVPQSIVNS